ncbi:MAG: phosphoglucosamine mutase [Christensenellales bacterium]|jgi:phosphoglucosamine mutase
MGRLFGTDGVRGKANYGLTPTLAYKLGRAGASVLTSKNGRPRVLVGKDTRISGDMLEAALIAGICSVGADALPVGVIPTPAVAHLTRISGVDAGVVISASHNHFGDNGIKFFNKDGQKLSDEIEDKIEDIVLNGAILPMPTDVEIGRVIRYENAAESYMQTIIQAADEDISGLEVVLDCANGAASGVASEVFSRLGATVTSLFDRPDGANINEGCGTTNISALQEAVRQRGGVGFAFDGDADRMIAVDENGQVVDGDNALAICADIMLEEGSLNKRTVVGTVMSNLGFEDYLNARGAKLIRTKVGDRYVLEEMLAQGYNLGGEASGHLIFMDISTTGDGILAAVKLACAMRRRKKRLCELREQLKQYPQTLINVRVSGVRKMGNYPQVEEAVQFISDRLGKSGRVLVRPSGTEPLIRIMVEGKDEDQVLQSAKHLEKVIRQHMV